jgi:monoamine oxidase
MAHTPLLRTLRRWFRERRALRGDAPRPGRRAFLAGAAATAALTALPARAARGDARVAVVGAGIAGLACALELKQLGIDATVYEASGRVGGRMFSLARHWEDGQLSEWGGELIDSGHHTMRNLAMRYGFKLDHLLKAQPAGSEDTYYLGGEYSKAEADADFGAVYDAVSADLDAAGYPTTFESSTPEGRKLDKTSVAGWIDARVPGGLKSRMGRLLELAYVIEYGADADEQSALNLVYLLGYQPNGNGKTFNEFGVSDEAYHIRGGNEQLPRAMADELGKDALRPGHRLVRLAQKGGRYVLSFDKQADVVADWVVLALPFSVLAHVDTRGAGFDGLKQKAIQELGRGLNGKTQLQFASRGWNPAGNGSSYSDTGYQAGWEATRAQAGKSGILVFYSGGSPVLKKRAKASFATEKNPDVTADAAEAAKQVEPVFPGLTWNGLATQSLPHLSPLFRASYAFYRPGQYQEFGGTEGRRQGGVLFCGEHTSQDYQGFMEGGASEGVRAARELSKLI